MKVFRFLRQTVIALAAFVFFLGACNKNSSTGDSNILPPVELKDSTVTINSFVIEKKNNPELLSDITFSVKGDSIIGNLSRYHHAVTPSFTSNATKVTINGAEQVSATHKVDFKNNLIYTFFAASGKKHEYKVGITWNDSLPQIEINTDNFVPVTSKEDYLKAAISIDGKNIYGDYSGLTQIKGRGNSTWGYAKKPYRLKLDTKAPLFGLSAEKDWVLLANYLDETHLLNSIAFHVGQKLNIPFTNHGIPVELTLNGQYKGVYLFTEQVEVESNRVNVGADGLLLELDSYFDETWKFKSTNYQLPVNIKSPDLENASQLAAIQSQFQQMEQLVFAASFPANKYLDYIDAESIANFLIVFMLTDNEEINHPKSIYLNKTANGKFMMGPIWDFDWAYGFSGGGLHFAHFNSFFWQGTQAKAGTYFFSKFLADPQIVNLLKQKWGTFAASNDLQTFIDEWAFRLEGARNRDYQLWKRGNAAYPTDIVRLKTWLGNRINHLTTYINSL